MASPLVSRSAILLQERTTPWPERIIIRSGRRSRLSFSAPAARFAILPRAHFWRFLRKRWRRLRALRRASEPGRAQLESGSNEFGFWTQTNAGHRLPPPLIGLCVCLRASTQPCHVNVNFVSDMLARSRAGKSAVLLARCGYAAESLGRY